MTGKTHVIVGTAAGLAAASALAHGLTSPAGLACAAAGGALGGMLPDLDVRNTAHPLQERLARGGCAALLVAVLALEGTVSGQDFLTIFLIVVSFYFGTQSQKLQDTLDGGDDGR